MATRGDADASPRRATAIALLGVLALVAGCARELPGDGASVVFRHAKLFGDARPLDALIERFERETGIEVRRATLPSGSDEQHLFYAINLRSRSAEFDLFALDVVWVAEFARAGWLRDLSHLLGAAEREDLFPGALAGVTWNDRVYALPWFLDAGLLYYRKDLLAEHGLEPPRTWEQLAHAARVVTAGNPDLHGFVFQGKQYEGLVCNALEHVWSFGGDVPPSKDEAQASARGLAHLRELVETGVAPDFVTTLTEEPSRVLFGRGRAVFLRNWPYAWSLFEREGSAVRGRVGVSVLPHAEGHASAATLGGWQLGVNRHARNPEGAERLAAFLAGPEAQRALALAYGYSPPRRSAYADPELLAAQPFLASLRDVFEAARPRPVSPYYVALSQEMQSQFSAVLTGRRPADAALASVSRALDRMEAQ